MLSCFLHFMERNFRMSISTFQALARAVMLSVLQAKMVPSLLVPKLY